MRTKNYFLSVINFIKKIFTTPILELILEDGDTKIFLLKLSNTTDEEFIKLINPGKPKRLIFTGNQLIKFINPDGLLSNKIDKEVFISEIKENKKYLIEIAGDCVSHEELATILNSRNKFKKYCWVIGDKITSPSHG
ncbi:hypothetical protein GW920_02930 [Candidatus Falkowbacteria bacterium]|uniref:Uncharacterized protein n=1 Tax=Candidatus Falkowbacteria bacterium CG10_big_fil_rev_8_21_14_0_10_37_18 TaxID=1974562 RepID=A0A2H0V8U6_9BACT|nr:hypothetical protein [Candidatus Falkowbacteria bacterium]NCQ12605.1 hypothetical protein [Candidatus Falkowbacteria bacterium]OIO05568.1 MAG: hypothetical protein AUJ26_02695 [Candidatus Falkowbacteria bacterium CG1_02_37_21]PIR95493.1 MAG: hypothetical protein COT93_02160 [Candidatus Falkowbacteria bacterium CG10_big_fil_rev_8_21_14_0_10_37_18]